MSTICHFSACRNVLGHDEEATLRKIKVKIALKTKIKIGANSNAHEVSSTHLLNHRGNSGNRPADGWQCLSLQYSVAWPLHLIITPTVVDKYNDILKFLLTVRRTQCKLHETWSNQKKIEVSMASRHKFVQATLPSLYSGHTVDIFVLKQLFTEILFI